MAFKYDVLGTVRFGCELEDILKLKGIEDVDSFLHPTEKNVESELLFDNIEKARDVVVNHIANNNVIDLLWTAMRMVLHPQQIFINILNELSQRFKFDVLFIKEKYMDYLSL